MSTGAATTRTSATHRSTPRWARNQYAPASTTHTPMTANATSVRLRHPATAITSATAASTRANEARASQRRALIFIRSHYPPKGDCMRVGYERLAELDEVLHRARQLAARTVIFDIEPLVAYWDSGQAALDQGVALVLSQIKTVPSVQVVCFATNSVRRPSVVPPGDGVRVVYLASARKPLRITAYQGFPRPGMVI